MVKPVVHSTKHYVQTSLTTITGGTVLNTTLISGVAVKDKNTVTEVEEGAIVKAIYIEYWVRTASTTTGSGQHIIWKETGDTTTPTATDMAALGDWDNKRNIFYTTMGLFNDVDADAINIYKGWLKIPKGKQRFALGDVLRLTSFHPTVNSHLCGFATFKEYT